MKKNVVTRYDLDKVYFMGEYRKTVAYGKQNISIEGVNEQLRSLEQEKNIYLKKVANIINPEKDVEQTKYQQYQKWMTNEKKIKRLEIILILVLILDFALSGYLPVAIRSSLLFKLADYVLQLVVIFGPIAFIISKIIKNGYAWRYNQYTETIRKQVDNLGNNFERLSLDRYAAIDTLYLNSLDPAHKEMILLRRQQEMHNQDMLRLERARKKAEEQRLEEQQRTRQATEELLAMEKERERRYKGW